MVSRFRRIFSFSSFLKVLGTFAVFLTIAKFFLGRDLGEIISREAKFLILGMFVSYLIFVIINVMIEKKRNEKYETV